MENATITQGHKTQSNFHSFLSNVSVSHVNDFEHVESVLSSLIEDSPDDSQDIMPLSHELRQAITNMEDIEDVCFKFNLLSHLKNILLTSTHFFYVCILWNKNLYRFYILYKMLRFISFCKIAEAWIHEINQLFLNLFTVLSLLNNRNLK